MTPEPTLMSLTRHLLWGCGNIKLRMPTSLVVKQITTVQGFFKYLPIDKR